MHIEQPDEWVVERWPAPFGDLLLVADSSGRMRALDLHGDETRLATQFRARYGARVMLRSGAVPEAIRRALAAYFEGDLQAIDKIACKPDGTPFQEQVWAALRTIPAGQTLSYGALATRLGNPKAMRAVGLANGANPIAIVIPCHRVIGANGSLTGYGGGLERKRWLLAHEGRFAPLLS
ncbi:MAG: methylated-DNA--[protein]-cysteine S-methyltransferase [Steroidobacteraceae bacterium]|nr:methylated-DNA--[protein]-cysteine S-methyltransferase [Steroidobacteraceae bacterium]